MKDKNIYILIGVSGAVLLFIVIFLIATHTQAKGGGPDAKMPFNANTTSLTVTDDEKSVTFEGEEWKKITDAIGSSELVTVDDADKNNFTIKIDFNNTFHGSLSDSDNIITYGGMYLRLDSDIYTMIMERLNS